MNALREPSVIFGARSRTHSAIRKRALRAAKGLRDAGLQEGAAVALLLRNDLAFFEVTLAATLAGCHPVPINWQMDRKDIDYILRDSGAKALVAHADLLAACSACSPDLLVLIVEASSEQSASYDLGQFATPDGAQLWDRWLESHSPLDEPAATPHSPLIYTSGTTGRPKGVHRSGGSRSKGSEKALKVYGFDLDGRTVALITGPLYHSVPNAYGRLAMKAGADIILQSRFEPLETLHLIERHRVTHLHIVPSMMTQLLRLPPADRNSFDISSLRHVVHGAAPCPPDVKRAMIDWWGPVIHEYYGSTETGLLTLANPDDVRRKPGSVGRPLSGVTIEVLDERGENVPAGEAGEIYAGSANLHEFTYIGQEEKRAAIGRGNLVTAGDIGWLDDDGYLYLGDRKRDVIRANGKTIFPSHIEAALLNVPGVSDCAVFTLVEDGRDPLVCICVSPTEDATLSRDRLKQYTEDALGAGDFTLRIEILRDFPREESGKIFKDKLRERIKNVRAEVRHAG